MSRMKCGAVCALLCVLGVVAALQYAAPENKSDALTAEAARQAVENYCRETYDWSAAKENPDIMYVTLGEESASEYLVIFRGYTGAFVDFHVDKASGAAHMVERVPNLGIEEDAGSINVSDYLG